MAKCPNCGATVKDSAKYCTKCNHPMNSVVKSEGINSSNKIIIGIVAIICIVAVVGVIFAMGGFNSGDNSGAAVVNNTTNTTASTTVTNTTQDNGTVANDTNNSSADIGNVYVSSTKSNKFHVVSCEWAQKISDSNKITYPSRQAALDNGKVPCSVCNP